MFSLREFLMQGFRNAIGKMADYQVILNATAYYEKNILTEADLAELQALIEEKNTPVEPETTGEITETIEEPATEEPTVEITEETIETTEEN